MTGTPTGPLCPGCGLAVDPLRAGSVAILDGVFRYFCNQGCKTAYLQGRVALSDLTEAPPAVALRDRTPAPPAVALRDRTPAPSVVALRDRTPAPPAVALRDRTPSSAPEPESPLEPELPMTHASQAMGVTKEPPVPIAVFGISVALLALLLALLGPKMMAVRLPLVVLASLTALGFLGLSGSARARPLALLLAQVLPIGIAPILASLAQFGKTTERTGLLASADSVTTLAALVALSLLATELCARTVEGRLLRAVAKLSATLPSFARVVQGAQEASVPIDTIAVGAIMRVRAGERVPLDGVIVEKSESERTIVRATTIPVEVSLKDEVLAGFVVESGSIDLRVASQAERRWLSRIAARAEGAPDEPGPVVRSIGLALSRSGESLLARILPAGLFVAALSYAAAGFAVGARGAELVATAIAGFASISVTAVLVSVRLSTRHGLLRAWESGVTFQDSASIAALGAVDTALLSGSDGILCDEPIVVAVEAPPKALRSRVIEPRRSSGRAEVFETPRSGRPKKASISDAPSDQERRSPFRGGDHVLALAGSAQAYLGDEATASAIRSVFTERGLPTQPLRSAEVLPGLGVVGVLSTGERLVVGTHSLFLQEHISVAGAEGGAMPSGRKNVYVALDGRLQGTIVLDAVPRVIAAVAMQRLQARSVEPVLLSHESRDVVESVASAVCIEHVRPCASEEEAQREVDALVEVGRITAVIGFPERDEALFERAHVGLAMRATCQPFREWSVATMSSDPRTITAAFEESARLREAHRRSYAIALGPGAVALFAALFGLVPIYLPALFGMVGGIVALYRASVK